MSINNDALIKKAVESFAALYGSAPQACAMAPARVEILGNHTDYNEGYTLSAAINRYTVVALGDSPDGLFRLCTEGSEVSVVHELTVQPDHAWVNYPLGVYAIMQQTFPVLRPFSLFVAGNIPLGAGLSSSASFEVAMGLALQKIYNLDIAAELMAKICQQAEHTWCGTKCGLLDQYSVLFGKQDQLLCTEYRGLTHFTVPLGTSDLTLCITPSGVSHSLATSAYNDRRRECFAVAEYFTRKYSQRKTLRDISSAELLAEREHLDAVEFKRAMHIVSEDDRVISAQSMLELQDYVGFGKLFFDSHESSRSCFENSCDELDILVEGAKTIPGVLGSRLCGGGFGGATISLVESHAVEAFTEAIKLYYHTATGQDVVVHCASVAEGAKVLEV